MAQAFGMALEQELIEEAGAIELYGRGDDVRRALEAGNLATAARLCQEAMKESHYRARYNCAPIGPEGHVRQSQAIREFWSKLRRTLADPESR